MIGVSFALDDFGTGYSSLAYLRRFPVDLLKIDRAFVQGIESSAGDQELVEAIVRLGEAFGLGLVAEGIESEGQRAVLRRMGCTAGQGFLFSRPLPAEDVAALLAARGHVAPACVPAA
jgi:EAL domain-containing protein (putative c-di-GMP-specific phosphodiesterase class I)